jgi:hypothetical protein
MWRPHALTREQWPPDYEAVFRWRTETLSQLMKDRKMLAAAWTYYSTHPAEFIMHWMDTYDPRRPGDKWIPFVFFEKQAELVDFLEDLTSEQENGLLEKARDMGATWVACGYSVWCLIFKNDHSIGWGSRKEALVDKLGDADSIFEKMRLILKRIPKIWLPDKFNAKTNTTFMKLVNPGNGAYIGGEAGDNIGRGGRKSMYFKDEAAHYERPEKIEAALGDNTNCQVDISSVNGLGNVFHRRRENGVTWERGKKLPAGFVRVFVMDWKDHPAKTQEWYDIRKAKYEREGMSHVFAQEVDRNYSAAVSNTVISYDWITASVDAHLKVPYIAEAVEKNLGKWVAGLDVADQGNDRNALSMREWIIWRKTQEWGERDPGVTARRAIIACRPYSGRISCQYDSIGVGAGVKTEYNRITQDVDPSTGQLIINARDIPFIPWNAGASVQGPYNRIIPDDDESLMNKDFFANLKAQAWWSLRTRFYKTYKAVTEGIIYPVDELISLDSDMPLLQQLMKELAQPTRGQSSQLKMLIDKQPEGTNSPNLADSGVQMFFPITSDGSQIEVGSYGH